MKKTKVKSKTSW